MKSLSFRVAPAVLAAALALPPAAPPAGAENRSTDRVFEWSWRLEPGQRLEVRGMNGGIRVRPSSGREARVTAEKASGKQCDAADVRVEFAEDRDGIVVCALYPRRDGRNECGSREDWSSERCDARVEWTVEVPAGVRFVGRTVNGGVQADGLRGPADLQTVNGSIAVETTSWATAHTVNGSITASIDVERWDRRLEFKTVNGDVEVELPREVSAELSGRLTNGRISSDFPVRTRRRIGSQRVTGRLGDGGSPLNLSTINGNLVLRARS